MKTIESDVKLKNTFSKVGLMPLYDRLLVKPDNEVEQTKSGIIIPVESRKKSNTGTVIAIGGGTTATPMIAKEGDRILYQRYAGLEVEWKGEAYTIILAHEVVAIIDPSFEINDMTTTDQNQ